MRDDPLVVNGSSALILFLQALPPGLSLVTMCYAEIAFPVSSHDLIILEMLSEDQSESVSLPPAALNCRYFARFSCAFNW